MRKYVSFVAFMVPAVMASQAGATVLLTHSGSTDPTTETPAWSLSANGTGTMGSGVTHLGESAWKMTDPAGGGNGAKYLGSPISTADFDDPTGWTVEWKMAGENLKDATGDDEAVMRVFDGHFAFAFTLKVNGTGAGDGATVRNRFGNVTLVSSIPTIAERATGFHSFALDFDPGSNLYRFFYDNAEVTNSNVTPSLVGTATGAASVGWGGFDGNTNDGDIDVSSYWNFVQFRTGTFVPPVVITEASWRSDTSGDWNLGGNWIGPTPTTTALTARFGGVITAPRTVYTDVPTTVGGLIFDNANRYVLAGAGSLTLQVASGTVAVNVLQGSHKINLPLIIASDASVTIANGASLVIGNPMTIQANRIVTHTGDLQIQAALTMESGAVLNSAGGSLAVFGAPSLAAGAKINLMSNSMTVDYSGQPSPAASILSQLTAGYAAGSWNGDGIMSSTANGVTSALGWKEDTTNKKILIDYTHPGDTDLSGVVDSTDFNALAASYGKVSGAVWVQGDFNYDGKVNTIDFNALAGNFGAAALPSPALGAVVPEPGVFGLGLAMLSFSALSRRRA